MALLSINSLKKYFPVKKGFMTEPLWVKAVDGIDFSIDKDRVFALVGESGCGKSTVARLVLRLITPTSGKVMFEDKDVFSLEGDSLKAFRKSVQIIFQDPFASLNPRMTVFDTISEPLRIHRIVKKHRMKDSVVKLLAKVGLGPDIMNRYPHEFSGGQRQRICIARALAVSPEVIVADEPLSALDVSIQAQILNLLQELKKGSKISFLFISHDLKVVHYFSDSVGVMYLGKIVEHAKTDDLFRKPLHPYTELLLSSAPKVRVKSDEFGVISKDLKLRTPTLNQVQGGLRTDIGEVPSPIDIPAGCQFHPRCPKRFEPCDKVIPVLKPLNQVQGQDQETDGRLVACHLIK
ncbi:MAG: ATP-binding cassette domain-containing protein [Nitrospirae bacterium]|nr:ATP-binding cassette domain-containing protein [Nitrospirota bacterium]